MKEYIASFKGWPVLRTGARKPPLSFSFLDIWAPGDSRVLEKNATIRLLRANLANIRSELRFLREVTLRMFPSLYPGPTATSGEPGYISGRDSWHSLVEVELVDCSQAEEEDE